jgi:hypothetical protein
MIVSNNSVDLNSPFFVYTLSDPSNNKVKYVGITNNPNERYRKHLTNKKITLKNNWIKSLKSKGLNPLMNLIDSDINRELINEKEKYWIIKHREWDCDLKNMTSGGDGGDTMSGRKLSEEAKKKISIANKGRTRDMDYLNSKKRKAVQQICFETKRVIAEFESVVSASIITGCSKTNISKFANGNIKETIKKVGGYEWKYIDKF